MFTVRIKSSAEFYSCIRYQQHWKDENKEKEAGNGPFFKKTEHNFAPKALIKIIRSSTDAMISQTKHGQNWKQLSRYQIKGHFLMGHSRPLFIYFRAFQTNITIFTKIISEKISIEYTILVL